MKVFTLWTRTVVVSYLLFPKQTDRNNCVFFAIVFAAEILDGKLPLEADFNVTKMRLHPISCLVNERPSPFPKI